MVKLTIDTVSSNIHCSTHLPSLLLPRGLFVQAAGRKMGVHLVILREWAGKMKTSDLSQAQDRILGKALWDPNRLWQNHHEEPPTWSGLGFHSLFE